jgi:type II secretory pathway pseudopilin PulG
MTPFRRALADQRGFTMLSIIFTMTILSVFAVGAWAAANGAQPTGRQDVDRKRAYEAAEAGVQWYSYQLARDTNYWTYCSNPTKVKNFIYNQGARGANWGLVDDANPNGGKFQIELMPVSTTHPCSESDPSSTLLDDGVLRVRSTGYFNGKLRQVVGTFRRSGFLDYVWYTKWETAPPASYPDGDYDEDWAATACAKNRPLRSSHCSDQQFKSDDVVNGPLHTEDTSLLACGGATFGRTTADKIEILGATNADNAYTSPGTSNVCHSGAPHWAGTLTFPSKQVDLPESNSSMAAVADLTYTGTTCLKFNANNTMSVYANLLCTGTSTATVTLTGDTTIWVANNGTCAAGYDYYQKYANTPACGNVGVEGTYSKNITVGSINDIVVVGNLQHTGDGLMGLVANQFVRVYHPVTWNGNTCGDNAFPSTNPKINRFDAAVLATTGSFLADNAGCGADLGSLTINGAIAQKWRGTVGTTSDSQQCDRNGRNCTTITTTNGYTKDYNYDDRLRYREPPNFLDPVTVTWNLLRESEQSPVQ